MGIYNGQVKGGVEIERRNAVPQRLCTITEGRLLAAGWGLVVIDRPGEYLL